MAAAKYTRATALGVLIFASVLVAQRYDHNTLAAGRPLHSAIIVLLFSGVALHAATKYLSEDGTPEEDSSETWDLSIPLKNLKERLPPQIKIPQTNVNIPPIPVTSRQLIIGLAAACIVIRAATLRATIRNVECAHRGVESLLPFLLAIFEAWIIGKSSRPPSPFAEGSTRFGSIQEIKDTIIHSRLRYIVPTLLMTLGSYIAAISFPRSTYICPIAPRNRIYAHYVNSLQVLGICLDIVIITCITRLLESYQDIKGRLVVLGNVLISAAVGLCVVGGIFLFLNPEHFGWAFNLEWLYIGHSMVDVFAMALFFLSVAFLSGELRLMTIVVISFFACNIHAQLPSGFDAYFPRIGGLNNLSIPLVFAGTAAYFYIEISTESPRALNSIIREAWIYRIIAIVFCVIEVLSLAENTVLQVHPIDNLMANAKMQHELWLKHASAGVTLQEAVSNYQTRYHRTPPPNFDKWFEFAKSRNAVIIDDYDQIEKDLQPFMFMAPSQIRNATDEMLLNQWNDIAGLSIRDGKTQISPHIIGTHRWMLDGITGMIDKFSEWLPDMDLAFNINDECRVIIPWMQVKALEKRELKIGKNLTGVQDHGFTHNDNYKTVQPWQNETASLPFGPTPLFEDHSFAQDFYTHATSHCPPGSPARTKFHWRHDIPCPKCTSPFTRDGFVSNWTVANDMCLQPDMAYLHGFHLSPATYKTSTKLLPIFSQSKVLGYNDILYPSPWNYMDKVKYEEDKHVKWSDKKDSLFWRGGTSEGKSEQGEWTGMQRQRFVHWANNESDSTLVPVLTPLPSSQSPPSVHDPSTKTPSQPSQPPPTKYKSTYLSLGTLRRLLTFDLGFVDSISRCGRSDCRAQEREFGFKAGIDFQEHWQHKYLLDLDGAGFSGRFIPFLQSGSLVVKAALFREWWQERVTPWLHFVPIDARGVEIGGVVGFFAGLGGASASSGSYGRKGIGGRDDLAEYIATHGREWADTVLRKEDMEVYFFRLLLEWGRIVDERREFIGFVLE